MILCTDVSVDDCSEPVRALGYPRVHRHRLACMRQELVDAFVEYDFTFILAYCARVGCKNRPALFPGIKSD